MSKVSFGLFGLFILLGNQFGSIFGIALAICVFMIIDGAMGEFKRRETYKNMMKKKEGK